MLVNFVSFLFMLNKQQEEDISRDCRAEYSVTQKDQADWEVVNNKIVVQHNNKVKNNLDNPLDNTYPQEESKEQQHRGNKEDYNTFHNQQNKKKRKSTTWYLWLFFDCFDEHWQVQHGPMERSDTREEIYSMAID